MAFVHLHLHTEYSLLDGACRIKDIPAFAKKCGQTAVAITDHGAMFGVVDFFKACSAEGIKAIIGCEVYLAPHERNVKENDYSHLVLLCKDETGYKNLIKIVSLGYTEGFYNKPRIDTELLEKYSEGLICLSGCINGRISKYLLSDDYSSAKSFAEKLNGIFGDGNFYLEIQNHNMREELHILPYIERISAETGIPLVATNDVHYLEKKDAETQEILMCIQTNNTLNSANRLSFPTDEFYFKTEDEMLAVFKNYREAVENTQVIADKCNFEFKFNNKFLPKYILPEGTTATAMLKSLAQKGMEEKTDSGLIQFTEENDISTYQSRLTYELFIINHMGYDEYFLIVWDFVNYAKKKGIPVGPGRGSGAGSLVAFLIGITEVDPIKHNLLFERFLNPERVSMPDFDIDFCYERRDEVINYVCEKYGNDRVCQIITFGTMAARAVVRDVGRVLGMSTGTVDNIAKTIPKTLGITLDDALEGQLGELYKADADVRRLIDVSKSLEGMPRHASTHAAGVVITDKALNEYIPLAVSSGAIVSQFDMDTIAELGLLKFDFLALRYLTVVSDSEKLIKRTEHDFDMRKIPEDDAETFAMLSVGKSEGVFQLESTGMKRLLASFKPKGIEDIMIAIALYRPGPMESIPQFLENRKNKNIEYSIPILHDILDETSGCIVYQEQVMQIFRKVANYSYGKADIIRRIMAKKKKGELEKEKDSFIAGAKRNFINEKDAKELFDSMASFASYAFNKSHAAAYSVTSYRTAYLRCHYPKEYFSALLTSVIGDVNKTAEYINECSKLGITVLPPDINESEDKYTLVPNGIRFPLLAIKNIGTTLVDAVIKERERGKYTSFENFISRLPSNECSKRSVESLIKAGVFSGFGITRAQLLVSYDEIIEQNQKSNRSGTDGQIDLFEGSSEMGYKYPDIKELPLRDIIAFEKESCCYCFSGHLIDYYSKAISVIGNVSPISDLLSDDSGDGNDYTVCGIITKISVKTTKNGDAMAFLTIEDRTGEFDAILFPKIYAENITALSQDIAVAIFGKLSVKDEDNKKIIAGKLILLENNDNFKPLTAPQQKNVKQTENAQAIKKAPVLFLRFEKTEGEKYLHAMNLIEIFDGITAVYVFDSSSKKYTPYPTKCDLTEFLVNELSMLLGKENVVIK